MSTFDDMEKAEVEPLWVNLLESGGYQLQEEVENDDGETEMEVVREYDVPLVGVVQTVEENMGTNSSRIYTIRTHDTDRPLKLWGAGHLNQLFDNRGLGPGDEIGVRLTGDTFSTRNGEATEYDLRFSRAGD